MYYGLEATHLGHDSFHKKTMPGTINASDILFSKSIQRTYKRLPIIDVIIPHYSSKKMDILNEHFPASIVAFAR